MFSDRIRELVGLCQSGEDVDSDELVDVLGVSTPEQAVALAVGRGWIGPSDERMTDAQRAYVREFDKLLVGEPGAQAGKARALRRMFAEADMDDPRDLR